MERVKIIKEWLKAAQSHQKSYSDVRRRNLEFKEDDWIFLKVSPMKGIMRFGKKGKLSLRYVRPTESFRGLKVIGDSLLIVLVETIEANEELSYKKFQLPFLAGKFGSLEIKKLPP
ncbi:PREDICTED: uncharacterized protein LOC109224206 [Nicotiana attenuata]|uniref:uncharacterized protein LOC109224206 n=1 Tax=Nicotiana attenuata TaxID=49451 RepID=UPI0009049DCE|nr:PREDICTED: uncharacterized protein LOC109224206 [Nicotiana attenuata]